VIEEAKHRLQKNPKKREPLQRPFLYIEDDGCDFEKE
jgi:hypothetical protein